MRAEALIVVGLGYGDEGKGSVVDHLARACDARAVVRFNGGAQAAHNVVLADGRQHTFAQFGSGTFAGAATHLSRYVLVNPLLLFLEAEQLARAGVADPLARLTISADAPITTPFHIAANQLRELARGGARHGSCGLGIGETMRDVVAGIHIRAGDLRHPARLREALIDLQERKRREMRAGFQGAWPLGTPSALRSARALNDTLEVFATLAETVAIVDEPPDFGAGTVIYEGAQGVLLDEHAGFFPHVTWSRTTPVNARALAGAEATTIGVARTYMTRHGAGPLVTEDAAPGSARAPQRSRPVAGRLAHRPPRPRGAALRRPRLRPPRRAGDNPCGRRATGLAGGDRVRASRRDDAARPGRTAGSRRAGAADAAGRERVAGVRAGGGRGRRDRARSRRPRLARRPRPDERRLRSCRVEYVLFHGRHHLLTRFQGEYLARLAREPRHRPRR